MILNWAGEIRPKSRRADRCTRQIENGVLAILLLLTLPVAANANRTRILLDKCWHVKQLTGSEHDVLALTEQAAAPGDDWLAARMPAQVHDVLLEHGKIADPRIGKNAAECAWVGEHDWAYACSFPSPKRQGGPVFLCFDGLDTLADAYLNGQHIGSFDNMYRGYRVDVSSNLLEEQRGNTLLIVFKSPSRFVAGVDMPEDLEGVSPAHFLRKCHSDFGSYLGARPHSAKVGVFRHVYLDLPGRCWIEDSWVRPKLSDDFQAATVDLQIEIGGGESTLDVTLIGPDGEQITGSPAATSQGVARVSIAVESPQLWWPRTHGPQPLYRVVIDLNTDGRRVDSRQISFGIRKIQPVSKDPDTGEERFRFDVNGQPVFLRGADLAPVEGMTHCWNEEKAMRLLDLMEHGRMNVLRIWAEGNIPPQSFYDECDRRGILIWQDFMFGYGMHPSGQAAFDENCRLEIEGMVRSLRNHPCLLLWVGGNENHMAWDFRYGTQPGVGNSLFDELMPKTVSRLDPDRLFHPSSPHGGRVPNWPLEGDWHDYSTLKYCPHASVPTYASEVGRASAPSISSMRRFLSEEELWPEGHDPSITTPGKAAWPPMWQYRSVGGSWDKVGALEQYCDPKSAADLIRVLGTAHGDYLRNRVERERRGVPDGAPDGNRRCWGNMVWRLNDSWPIIYWAVIDYYLEPKIAYYYLRRAYDPVLVTFERTEDEIFVWVVNDSPVQVAGTLSVSRRSFSGETRGELQAEIAVPPGVSKRCLSTTALGPVVMRKEYLQAKFAGREASQLLIGERYLHLPDAKLAAHIVDGRIEIRTGAFARQVTLSMNGVTGTVFEDNFFDLPPNCSKTIRIIDAAGGEELTVGALNAATVVLKLE